MRVIDWLIVLHLQHGSHALVLIVCVSAFVLLNKKLEEGSVRAWAPSTLDHVVFFTPLIVF